MKKLINDPRRVVPEMLEGMVLLDSRLALLGDDNTVVRADLSAWRARDEVAVISGGGAGHEPAHAGYVGQGMLTAAVSGDVFTSPSADAVLNAILACAGSAGVLLVVKNYTGDRLNFGLAAEMARARGVQVEMVVVADDAALEASALADGARGLAGTVWVHKVAGAAAAAGLSLADVRSEAERAATNIKTFTVALSACTVPAAGAPGFLLGDQEVEFGLGIHGERGAHRALLRSADSLVDEMLEGISGGLSLGRDARVAILVNNLGGTPMMELAIVARRVVENLQGRGIVVERAWSGTYLTSLEMAGCSLSVMRLDDLRRDRLDAPCQASSWRPAQWSTRGRQISRVQPNGDRLAAQASPAGPIDARTRQALTAISSALAAARERLTTLDQVSGDGDLGISMARAAEAIEANADALARQRPPGLLRELSGLLLRSIGGSSGPFYAVGLLRAAKSLEGGGLSIGDWALAMNVACDGISQLGGAGPGDRTMLDALRPAADALRKAAELGVPLARALELSATAAAEGARLTSQMTARRGRASYLGARAVGSVDPGAEAVAIWLGALRSSGI